jgi:hypothetical protein
VVVREPISGPTALSDGLKCRERLRAVNRLALHRGVRLTAPERLLFSIVGIGSRLLSRNADLFPRLAIVEPSQLELTERWLCEQRLGTAAVSLFRSGSLYVTTVTLVAGDELAHEGSDYRVTWAADLAGFPSLSEAARILTARGRRLRTRSRGSRVIPRARTASRGPRRPRAAPT